MDKYAKNMNKFKQLFIFDVSYFNSGVHFENLIKGYFSLNVKYIYMPSYT